MKSLADECLHEGGSISSRIKLHITGGIREGRLKPGQKLPSLRTMARELNISLATAERAMRELTASGSLEAHQGKGFFVRSAPVCALRVSLDRHSILQDDRELIQQEFQRLAPEQELVFSNENADIVETPLELIATRSGDFEDIGELALGLYGRKEEGGDIFTPFRESGALCVLPILLTCDAVIINRDLFDRLRVPVPTSDWTWEDLLETARLLHRPKEGICALSCAQIHAVSRIFLGMVLQNGGHVFDPSGAVCRLAEAEAIQAAEHLRTMARFTAGRPENYIDSMDEFHRGRIAMFHGNVYVSTHYDRWTFQLEALPLPQKKARLTISEGIGFGVRRSKQADGMTVNMLKVLAGMELWPGRGAGALPLTHALEKPGPVRDAFMDAFRHSRHALVDIEPPRRREAHRDAVKLVPQACKSILYGTTPVAGVLMDLRDQMMAFVQPASPFREQRAAGFRTLRR